MAGENYQNETEEPKVGGFKRKTIIRGVFWFVLITVITMAAIFIINNTGDTLGALKKIKGKFIFLCFGMLVVDLFLGALRNHIFVWQVNKQVNFWASFKANVANMFMGAVTPAHGGAAPAQIYVYMSSGLKFVDAFSISLINFGATLVFMPIAAFMAVILLKQEVPDGLILNLLNYGFSFFFLFLIVFIFIFFKPLLAGKAIRKIAVYLAGKFPRYGTKLKNWGNKSYSNIQTYQQTCKLMLRKNPLLFPIAVLITFVLYLNKYVMQYVILLGLGIQADLYQVIAYQVLIQFMIYFAPSPGGSGFAEAGIAVLFAKIVNGSTLPLFTLLQRSFLLFFPAIIGAFVMIGQLNKDIRKTRVIKGPANDLTLQDTKN